MKVKGPVTACGCETQIVKLRTMTSLYTSTKII